MPAVIVTDERLSFMDFGTTGFTVTLQVAFLPFEVLAVMVAAPAFFALITPPEAIPAMLGLLELQNTVLSLALEGLMVA